MVLEMDWREGGFLRASYNDSDFSMNDMLYMHLLYSTFDTCC